MPWAKIVCPAERGLIARLPGREIAPRVDDPAAIPGAARAVRETGSSLMAVLLDWPHPLDRLEFCREWGEFPLGIVAPSLGRFRDLAPSLPLMRGLDLRVFLPCTPANLTGLRILSSLGIPTGLLLDQAPSDWEGLSDLMTYALLETVPHARVEPFDRLMRTFTPGEDSEWASGCFDDPSRFAHLDRAGRVAASPRDLREGRFAGTADDPEAALSAAVEERARARRVLFVENHPCTRCAGFRACQGRFAGQGEENLAGCSAFFTELLQAIQQVRERDEAEEKAGSWRL